MERKVAVVGLGYVGLPVAVAFGEMYSVVGFDVDEKRIFELRQGIDVTGEVSGQELNNPNIEYTSDKKMIRECNFVIVSVPTPIDDGKQPDLTTLVKASETIGENLSEDAVVVYESTVYPGATEEVCVPLLEEHSGMKAGIGFFVGYSPERINPGDEDHRFKNITKVVSGQDEYCLNVVAETYGEVIDAEIYRAPSIKVAEAAKVIENIQRDLNIAFMNELAIIFDRLGIDTNEVLKAANTKWNFIPFRPGLVGGHCIGVDPYYLTYKAENIGYYPEVILAGRRINNSMGKFIASSVIKQMIVNGYTVKNSTVTVLGITFKENVSDIRNTKVVDIVSELEDYGLNVQVTDPRADGEETRNIYGIELVAASDLKPSEAVIIAVPHQEYIDFGWCGIQKLLRGGEGIVGDVKGIVDVNSCPERIKLWRL